MSETGYRTPFLVYTVTSKLEGKQLVLETAQRSQRRFFLMQLLVPSEELWAKPEMSV